MDDDKKEQEENNKGTEATLFAVPLASIEMNESIYISTNKFNQTSKEQLIKKAFQLHSQGNISEAAKYYKQLISQGSNDHRVFSNYGVILKDFGKLQQAESSLLKAIKLKPDSADAHYNLGNTLRDLGNLKKAKLFTLKAIELNPEFAEAHLNLGNILSDLGDFKEAVLSVRKAIKLKPDFADAYSNLGTILRNLGRSKEAELYTRKAIELKPDFADPYLSLGTILLDLGKLQDAESSLLNAIKLKPDYAEAYFNLSLIELLKGNYQSGLENYEFRLKTKKPTLRYRNTKLKRVHNQKLHKGEKLLVISEQGLGDTLQFMRYLPYLRDQGLDVSFSAQTKLHSLIQSSGIDPQPFTPEEASTVSEGQWIPLLSLPRYLKVTPEDPIINQPYIYSTSELNQKWKDILSREKRPIVGLNWQGNPKVEKKSQKGRSLPLETFSTIAKNNNFKFLSLQKGFGSEQFDHCSFKNKFVKCQSQIDSTWDFLENAAIIENCDLVITCDTSIAHLAGGMGKKVWLLLRNVPHWTWGLEGENTFWYPSMRLFRQQERHNWQEVMERVSNQLHADI